MIGPELTTERLILKALEPSSVGQAYVDWLTDPRVNQFLETRHSQHSLASVRAFVEGINASDHSVLFGVFPRTTGVHIGNIKLESLVKEVMPLVIAMVIALIGLNFFPQVILFLPNLMR